MKLVCAFTGLLIAATAARADAPEQLFNNNCAICHQLRGAGVEGQFPRLAGRAGAIAATPDGRNFLISLVLTGMSGTVAVDGKKIVGVMPDFSAFPDEDLAAILTYVSSLGGGKVAPFKPEEIAAARKQPPLAPADLAANRNRLQASKVIP